MNQKQRKITKTTWLRYIFVTDFRSIINLKVNWSAKINKILRLEWMVHLWDDLCLNSHNAKLIWIVKMHHVPVPLVVEIKLNFHLTNSIKSNNWSPDRKNVYLSVGHFGLGKIFSSFVQCFLNNSAKICSNESKILFSLLHESYNQSKLKYATLLFK